MPARARLVTLTQAKAQLGITWPDGDPSDVDVQDRLDAAEEQVLTYLKDTPERETWVDPLTAPGPVVEAIKALLTAQHMNRADLEFDFEAFWRRMDIVLAQYHRPAVA